MRLIEKFLFAITMSRQQESSIKKILSIFLLCVFCTFPFLFYSFNEKNMPKKSAGTFSQFNISSFDYFKMQQNLGNNSYLQKLITITSLKQKSKEKVLRDVVTHKSKLKIILMWDNVERWWNGGNSMPADISTLLANAQCPFTSCLFTQDVSLIRESDLVVFYAQTMNNFPINRHPHQRFVFAQLESPISHSLPKVLDDHRVRYGYFNWTMTYRWDSDIVHRGEYGYIVISSSSNNYNGTGIRERSFEDWAHKKKKAFKSDLDLKTLTIHPQLKRTIRNKTKLVAWFVSHCITPIRREEYVRQLSEFITVDIFGRCNNRDCPTSRCNEMLRTDYKFYLAFENSWCIDYVTEKFYRSLMYDTVPIVMGGANYSRFAPPHSYINARDFDSPRKLAEYLLLLDRTESLYKRYFEWKKYYEVLSVDNYGLCDLCRMAHDDTLPPKTYRDIKQWWMDKEICENDVFF